MKHEAVTAGFAPVLLPVGVLLLLRFLITVKADTTIKQRSGQDFQYKSSSSDSASVLQGLLFL